MRDQYSSLSPYIFAIRSMRTDIGYRLITLNFYEVSSFSLSEKRTVNL